MNAVTRPLRRVWSKAGPWGGVVCPNGRQLCHYRETARARDGGPGGTGGAGHGTKSRGTGELRPHAVRIAALALALVAAPPLRAASFAADPFATTALAPGSHTGSWHGMGADPCAQLTPHGRAWNLIDVVNRALCANPRTRETWFAARAQAARLGASESAYLPTLNATVGATRSRTFSSGGFQIPTQNRVTPGLSLDYLLFDFGARSAAVENARESLYAADWSHNATIQTVLLDAVQAYYRLFAAQAAERAARASERSSQEALEAARVRHRVGAATLADTLQAQTAYAQARLARRQAQGKARIAQGTLADTLGLPADAVFVLSAPAPVPPAAPDRRKVRALIEEAEARRPDLAAAEARVRAARAAVRQARAAGLPSLSLVGDAGYVYSDVLNDTRDWSVGVAVNIPLFTGFSTTYEVRAARADLENQRAQLDQLRNQVALDVWSAYQNLETARDSVTSSRTLLASARESARVALGRYRAGAGTIVDLLSALASLADARQQVVQARYDWYSGRAALTQALGHLDLRAARSLSSFGPPGPEAAPEPMPESTREDRNR